MQVDGVKNRERCVWGERDMKLKKYMVERMKNKVERERDEGERERLKRQYSWKNEKQCLVRERDEIKKKH